MRYRQRAVAHCLTLVQVSFKQNSLLAVTVSDNELASRNRVGTLWQENAMRTARRTAVLVAKVMAVGAVAAGALAGTPNLNHDAPSAHGVATAASATTPVVYSTDEYHDL